MPSTHLLNFLIPEYQNYSKHIKCSESERRKNVKQKIKKIKNSNEKLTIVQHVFVPKNSKIQNVGVSMDLARILLCSVLIPFANYIKNTIEKEYLETEPSKLAANFMSTH